MLGIAPIMMGTTAALPFLRHAAESDGLWMQIRGIRGTMHSRGGLGGAMVLSSGCDV